MLSWITIGTSWGHRKAPIALSRFRHGSWGILQKGIGFTHDLTMTLHGYCTVVVQFGRLFSTNWHDLVRLIIPNYPKCATVYHDIWRLPDGCSRWHHDLKKSFRLPIVLKMSKTVGRLCRCSKIFHELSGTITIAVRFYHGYTRITPILHIAANICRLNPILPNCAKFVTNRDTIRDRLIGAIRGERVGTVRHFRSCHVVNSTNETLTK
jgi:hypothetical protein